MVQPFFVYALLGFSLRGGNSPLMRKAHTKPRKVHLFGCRKAFHIVQRKKAGELRSGAAPY